MKVLGIPSSWATTLVIVDELIHPEIIGLRKEILTLIPQTVIISCSFKALPDFFHQLASLRVSHYFPVDR